MEETGGIYQILSYHLEISWIQDTWLEVVGESSPFLDLTYIEDQLTTGTDYKFRIRAENAFGWGPWSDEVTIRADEVPAQITPVTTTIETIYVRIAWNPPSTMNGSPLLEYAVYIIESDGVTQTQTASCDGTDPDIVASPIPSCLVELTELISAPYSLVQGDLVRAVVKSRNMDGWSPISEMNSVGALEQVTPH
jgi:hypothetical protein